MDISRIKGLEIGKRLVIRKPGQTGSTNWHSITIVEGYSYEYNFIYGRVRHGATVGTLLPQIPGWGAVLINFTDLDGFVVECK